MEFRSAGSLPHRGRLEGVSVVPGNLAAAEGYHLLDAGLRRGIDGTEGGILHIVDKAGIALGRGITRPHKKCQKKQSG